MGLFSQLQLVFACEFINDQVQYSCCCNEQDAAKDELGCTSVSGCFEEQSKSASIGANCCEVTYQQAPTTVEYSMKLADPALRVFGAGEVKPWDVRPGRWRW